MFLEQPTFFLLFFYECVCVCPCVRVCIFVCVCVACYTNVLLCAPVSLMQRPEQGAGCFSALSP